MADEPKPDNPMTASPPPSSPTSVTARFPTVDSDARLQAPDRGDDIVYRPLSGFAVAGFGIAAVYAVVVTVGAIVAALQGMPWLMEGWSAVFPIAAIVLSVVGWLQIQASESTRTGKALAVWAIALSIVVSLGYWAYYAATFFVIRGQAEAFCSQYFDKVREGKLESAFLLTVPPKQRPRDDPGLRDAIEHRFNVEVGQGKPGGSYFNIFKEHKLNYVLRLGGKDVAIQPLGVITWDYTAGSYTLRQRYRISTPELAYEGAITAKSTESQGKEMKGRQWQVVLQETPSDLKNLTPTEEGRRLLNLQRQAGFYLSQWQNRLRSGQAQDIVECYLATLEPAQREPLAQSFKKAQPFAAGAGAGAGAIGNVWTGFAGACAAPLVAQKCLPGYAAFLRGDFITLDEKEFWPTDEAKRTATLDAVRQIFHAESGMPMGIMMVDADKLASWSRDKDRIQIRRTVQFKLRTLPTSVEGDVLMECNANVLPAMESAPPPDFWRITGITLTSLRVSPPDMPAGMMGQEPGPGGGRPGGFMPPQ